MLLDVDDVAMGHTGVMRWNARDKWVVSKEVTHEPLIDGATFEQTQATLHEADGEPAANTSSSAPATRTSSAA